MILYCATTNPGKLREFRLAAERFGRGQVEIESLPDLGALAPVEETGDTFEANAVQKALYYSRHAPDLLFAEDSGLEVDALGGAPGVRSARFAGESATDQENNRLLLERLSGERNRAARYVCIAALAERGELVKTFRGTVDGEILESPRGENGFGYDPLFFYPAYGAAFAEVSPDRKLMVSHRGRAIALLLGWLITHR